MNSDETKLLNNKTIFWTKYYFLLLNFLKPMCMTRAVVTIKTETSLKLSVFGYLLKWVWFKFDQLNLCSNLEAVGKDLKDRCFYIWMISLYVRYNLQFQTEAGLVLWIYSIFWSNWVIYIIYNIIICPRILHVYNEALQKEELFFCRKDDSSGFCRYISLEKKNHKQKERWTSI